MTVYADQAISGSGEVNFTLGVRLNYALVHVYVAPYDSRPLEVGDPDHMLRMGWIAFGADTDVIDATSRTYWSAPVWLDFLDTIWHPIPTTDSLANDFGVWASRVRWSLGLGGSAWLYVYGV